MLAPMGPPCEPENVTDIMNGLCLDIISDANRNKVTHSVR